MSWTKKATDQERDRRELTQFLFHFAKARGKFDAMSEGRPVISAECRRVVALLDELSRTVKGIFPKL